MSVVDVLAGRAQWAIDQCDVLDGLRAMPEESVNCVVTSPPYFGLRDYGTAVWDGGDSACAHAVRQDVPAQIARSSLQGGKATTGHQREGFKSRCARCGAVRVDRQIGLEETPAAYVARMVEVFREVRRVLRSDGTCWVNLGDAYAQGGGKKADAAELAEDAERAQRKEYPTQAFAGYKGWQRASGTAVDGLKPKDLMGMPWRVALALQGQSVVPGQALIRMADALVAACEAGDWAAVEAVEGVLRVWANASAWFDGWWLRSDCIWAKPNPMPSSVTDRPTTSHEYLFLLTKSARYWYDADAINEPAAKGSAGSSFVTGKTAALRPDVGQKDRIERDTRNRRSIWTIPTYPFPEAHFATFPPDLVEPCVLAGCPLDGVTFDPFVGSGTTVLVALRHGRRAAGTELNPEYAAMARRRIVADAPMFNGGEAAE